MAISIPNETCSISYEPGVLRKSKMYAGLEHATGPCFFLTYAGSDRDDAGLVPKSLLNMQRLASPYYWRTENTGGMTMPDFTGAAGPMTSAGVTGFTNTAGTGAPEMWCVLSVETSGCGFLPDKRPKILFERHKLHALAGGIFDVSHPDISQPTAGGYGQGGANQYNRLAEAISLDRQSALKSASWGIGQIMGMNFQQAGFADVESMVTAMQASEDAQLLAMARFLVTNHLAAPLAGHQWVNFALGYNGSNYAANNYDGLLSQFYGHFSTGLLPDLTIRLAQVGLTYKNFDPKGIDGVMGNGTRSAIMRFQAANGMEQTGAIGDALLQALFS
jgi:hypothetical protein